jgi:glucose-1-phosphate cytidylyltransferase
MLPLVILAGGLGTRLREETEYKPKPMVEIGSHPVIWHIMKHYSFYGFNEFIICTGYKKEIIQDYFINFKLRNSDFTIDLNNDQTRIIANSETKENWKITIVDTGELSNTGERLLRIKKYIQTDNFMCTYGDGLSNVNITELVNFHNNNSKIATLTAVKPQGRFGVLEIEQESNLISSFIEKPAGDTWINGGFFVFKSSVFDYIKQNDILEQQPLETLSSSKQLVAYRHNGFWQPMDTYREYALLNQLWDEGKAPWKVW